MLIPELEHDTDKISEGEEGKYPGTMLVWGQQECWWGHQRLQGRIFTEHATGPVMLTLA